MEWQQCDDCGERRGWAEEEEGVVGINGDEKIK